jgi:putative methionine-R-sulfoxide reductase with GAF domain
VSGKLTLLVEQEELELGDGELARVPPHVRRRLVNRASAPCIVVAIGAAGEHVGRDGEAFNDWDEQEGRPPQEVPLPADVSHGGHSDAPVTAVTDADLVEGVRREANTGGTREERASRTAELIRTRTGRRWVGIYRLAGGEVRNLAWSGPAAPAYPNFPIERGLTGAAVRSRSSVLSNDVANDPRYLPNQDSTGSELIVPVLREGTVVGTLDIEDPGTDAFDDEDQTLFELLAAALSDLCA